MKKYLGALLILTLGMMMPLKAFAMVELDENGNVIPREPANEGEMSITSVEDQVTTTSIDDKVLEKDSSTSKGEYRVTSDDVTTTAEEVSLTSTANGSNNNYIFYIALSGIAGIALGSFGSNYIKAHQRG